MEKRRKEENLCALQICSFVYKKKGKIFDLGFTANSGEFGAQTKYRSCFFKDMYW